MTMLTLILAVTMTPSPGVVTSAAPSIDVLTSSSKAEAYRRAEESYKASPSIDANGKVADAAFDYGEEIMLSAELRPQEKYPHALKLFRRAVQFQPDHRRALDNITMIESIYASLGKPVPEG